MCLESDCSTLCMDVMQERNIFAWSTRTWKKEMILVAEPKYAGRPLVSGMLAVSVSRDSPVVFYSPMGKKTVRTIHMNLNRGSEDGKKDMYRAGYKLKTENKQVFVGLAADAVEADKVYVLTVDGDVLACRVSNGHLIPVVGIDGVPFSATQERVKLHAFPHVDKKKGGSIIVVEAERSGVSILESIGNTIRMIHVLKTGTGGVVGGFGFVQQGSLAVAAVCQARGNVGFFAWKYTISEDTGISFASCHAIPSSLWAALDGNGRGSSQSMLGMSDTAVVAGSVIHPKSGMMAFWSAASDNSVAVSTFKIPLISVISDDEMGTPPCHPLHSSPYFWLQGSDASHDGTVSELHFPRSTFVTTPDSVLMFDLAHGVLSTYMRPKLQSGKVGRMLVRTAHSSKRGVWMLFSRITTGEHAGSFQFSAVLDSQAAVSPGSWWFPGRDGVFAGSRDELAVVLTNSGKSLMIFDTVKLANHGTKGMISTIHGIEDGIIAAVFRGPVSRIPGPPKPKPEMHSADDDETDEEEEAAMQEWEAYEVKRREIPKTILALTMRNKLCLVEVSQASSMYSHNTRSLRSKAAYQLPAASAVIQVAWQNLMDPAGTYHSDMQGADEAIPCVLAVTMSDRVLFLSDKLELISSCLLPADAGIPVSSLWIGPSLVVSTSMDQFLYAGIDGSVVHAASAMMGPSVSILGALGDRLLYAYRNPSGAIESSYRAWDPVPMMLLGWAHLYSKSILPGSFERAEKSLKSLLSSYGATKIPISILDGVSNLGFADIVSAAASCSELPEMNDAKRGIFKAAAGDWEGIVAHTMLEYEESEFYPDHPEETSLLYEKMVILARSCELYGHFKYAKDLFEAAGAWRELFALCIFQGDFDGLHRYASRGGRKAELLANHLLAVNEDAFRRSVASNPTKFGGRPFVEDYELQESAKPMIAGDESPTDVLPAENFPSWDLAPSDRLPFMEATLQVDESAIASGEIPPGIEMDSDSDDGHKGDPISRVDKSKLASYLGFSGATIRPGSIITESKDEIAGEEIEHVEEFDFDDEEDSALNAVQRVITAGPESDTATETSVSESVGVKASLKSPKAQEEARAAFFASKKLIDDEFYSSDDESSLMGGESAANFASTTTNKLIFKIKSKEEIESVNDSESLLDAAKSLKLGQVSKASFKGLSSSKDAESSEDFGTEPSLSEKESENPVKEVVEGGDAFASLSGLGVTSTQRISPQPSGALPEEYFAPMKPQNQPAQVPQSDLLSGWNEFEALFASPETHVDKADNEEILQTGESSLLDFDEGDVNLGQPSASLAAIPPESEKYHESASKHFLASSWQKASREFGRAFSKMNLAPENEDFRRRCVSEYAAAKFMLKASKSDTELAARLARHAAGLALEMKMQLVCQARAAELNIKAGNHAWANEILLMILGSMESNDLQVKSVDPAKLQKLFSSCEGRDSNSSVPLDEDTDSTCKIVEVSQTLEEIDEIIAEFA